MYFIELTQQILREMRSKKLRSILALFGIVWGTVAVVLLLALGNGFYIASKNNMRGFVDGTLIFNHGATSMPFDGLPPGQSIHIKASDIANLKTLFPAIKAFSPTFFNQTNLVYKSNVITGYIQGVNSEYDTITNKDVIPGGRFLDPLDIKQARKVIVIGPGIKQALFPHSKAVGKQIFLNEIPFTIIAVLKQLSNTNKWYDNLAYIPYTTTIEIWGNQDVLNFIVLPKNIAKSDTLKNAITKYLALKYHFNPTDESAVWDFNMHQIYEFMRWFFMAIEIFLGVCGAMTLGVGGVGIANVMFLIVTERTHEIGLRLAIGARTSHVMFQILLESGLIVAIGGLIGFLLSAAILMLLQYIHLPTWLGVPHFSWSVFIATMIVLMTTALLAGYFPAKKAAKLQPVEALTF